MPELFVVALVIFRAMGAFGVPRFSKWSVSAAHAMAVMLVVTASAHFVPGGVTFMPNHADLVRMVPPIVPFAGVMVYLTGCLEVLGALGLIIAVTRRAAATSLAVLFVALLPANVYAALAHVPFNGSEATPLWLRVPEQLLYIGVAVWIAWLAPAGAASALRIGREPSAAVSRGRDGAPGDRA